MEISKIIYYNRERVGKTISLRELCLRDDADLEVIFHAVRDAIDTQDLLDRFKRICCDIVEFDTETDFYIRFTVLDVNGNTNYLKFRKRKEN